MKSARVPSIRIPLQATPAQLARLAALQARFSEACNALAPMVAETRCWNRVALHHMAYKQLRERFPDLGSQMVCNTIYSLSRISRIVYQHPKSPFNVARLGQQALPRLQFTAEAPVYFDRHTLSLKDGVVSMFTLDGRMRFDLNVEPAQERRFREKKLREIVLTGRSGDFALTFEFGGDDAEAADARERITSATEWPEYVLITADGAPAPQTLPAWIGAMPPTPQTPPRPRRPSATQPALSGAAS